MAGLTEPKNPPSRGWPRAGSLLPSKAMLATGRPVCLLTPFMDFQRIGAKKLIRRSALVFVCLFTIYFYIYIAKSGVSEIGNDNPKQSNYNLLVDGFRSGQLNLRKEVPGGLVRLTNPYDEKANADYRDLLTHRLHDMSLYQGKLYLYFGVTPALLLFWPWAALTGHYLFHWEATVIFCAIGFLVNLALCVDVRRRYFQDTPKWILIPLTLAVGLSSGVPILLARADIWEVPISCAYLLTSLTLAATWLAIHQRRKRTWWLAAASLGCGFAVGARPTAVFYAAALVVPIIFYLKENRGRNERRQVWKLLIPAIIPITVCGVGIATYNYQRFGNPLEFGLKYALAGKNFRPDEMFNANFFWYNVKTYLLSAARFAPHPPFVDRPLAMKSPPSGYWNVENVFGILIDTPIVWLVLALPLAWTGRNGEEKAPLQLLGATALWASTSTFLLLCFFFSASSRYEAEFLPPCILLSAISILGLERTSRNRLVMRMAWTALLCFSAAFNILYAIHVVAHDNRVVGTLLLENKLPALAANKLYNAVAFAPDDAESHNELGIALALSGHPKEADIEFARAIEIDPDNIKYRINRNQLCHLSPAGLATPQALPNPRGNASP
jgi:hypothetical protein